MNDVNGFRGVSRQREFRAALTTRDVPLGSFWCDGGFPDERCIFGPFSRWTTKRRRRRILIARRMRKVGLLGF